MTTKGVTISRIRRLVKATTADAYLTDRMIYSNVLKFAKDFIKRKDDSMKLSKYNSLFQTLPGVELEETSKIEAGCVAIETCCKFYRTKNVLPPIFEGSMGFIVRRISSIDGSARVYQTDPQTYVNMSKSSTFKYNKNKYFWIIDNRAFFPNVNWPVVNIEAMWENDIDEYRCDRSDCCIARQEEQTSIPEDLFPHIEEAVKQGLLGLLNIPKDGMMDNQNLIRS